LAYLIGAQGTDGQILRHEELEREFQHLLSEKLPYEIRMKRMEELCSRFGEVLVKGPGIQTLSSSERQAIRSKKNEIPFDLDFNAFLRLVLSELSFCHRRGQKRSHEGCDEGCHFTGYLCNAVRNCASNRFPMSVSSYSQALAWLLGDEEVGIEHLRTLLPFTLAHRIQWKEEAVAQREKEMRNDPLDIYMAKEAVKEMHWRYMEQGPQIKNALAVACRIIEGEAMEPIYGDHPIYWEIRRDLGEEVFEE
jgi:hypothetical protein